MMQEHRDSSSGYRARILQRYGSCFKGIRTGPELEEHCRSRAMILESLFGAMVRTDRPRRVLELGCGVGTFLWWARTRAMDQITGVDVSREVVQQALALGLPARIQDAREALQEHSGLDWIVALDFIEHFGRDDVLAILDLSNRALRPGGRLVMSTPNAAAWRPGPVAQGDLTHETILTPSTARSVLRLTGFDNVGVHEVRPIPRGVLSRGRRALWMVARVVPMIIDVVETGATGGVYSRVMIVHGTKTDSVAHEDYGPA